MHPTRNDLSTKTRTKVVAVLNARLADAIDLQFQAKQAHWNVKGPNFIALHELFGDWLTALAAYVKHGVLDDKAAGKARATKVATA